MDWNSWIAYIGYILASFSFGYLMGLRAEAKAWTILFDRLMNLLNKLSERLDECDDGDEWKKGNEEL